MIEKKVIATRTIWTIDCACGYHHEWTENPPRERQCPECNVWLRPKKQEFTGPDRFDGK